MPANLTPQYKSAEQKYKAAATPEEKIAALEEMLAVIPKHKGTEHLQADLKKKLSKLRSGEGSKAGAKHVDVFHVPPGGAGQVVLFGMPNCGKSSIVGALTNAPVRIEAFPFATDKPVPGMAYFEDVKIQLVDMPPITADYAPPGMVNTLRGCDLIAIVIDLAGEVLEQMEVCLRYLDEHRLLLDNTADENDADGNPLGRKTFILCTKCDLAPAGTLETLCELTERQFDYIRVSPVSGEGMDTLMKTLYDMLGVVRVYSKKPGHDVDKSDPFTLPEGSTVEDLARLIHRDLAEKLKSVRCWGTGVHDGQNVQRTHVLHDKDIVELHFT